MTPAELARLGAALADKIDRSSPTSAGLVRQLVGLVVEQAAALNRPGGKSFTTCPVCSGPIVQPARGRRRIYCCEEHRRQAYSDARKARNGSLDR